jgi:FkbH-like protein
MVKNKQLKIAVLSSYTINNVQDPLANKLLKSGFKVEIKFGGYKQFVQEILDNSSWIHTFNPQIVFLALSTATYLENIEYKLLNNDKIKEYLDEKINALKDLISNFKLSSTLIISSLEYPNYSPYGIKDMNKDNGLHDIVSEFNSRLKKLVANKNNVYLLDFEKVCSYVGKSRMTDDKLYYLGKILLSKELADALSLELTKFVNAIYGNVKKCIIVDLDNTLWGGILGEEGANGITLSDSELGSVYQEIQKILKNYKDSGTVLAIVSKNNLEDVLQVFKDNSNMILKEDDFVSKKINWENKVENVVEIAKELNLGLDSFVFLDDNPAERLNVKENLPMVEIIDFPKDVAKLPELLKNLPYFESIEITEEDKKRSSMYKQETERKTFEQDFTNLKNYLYKLGTKIKISKNDLKNIQRIAQLINKTNQFNLRTKRYSVEEVKNLMKSKDTLVFSVEVWDKFGELGLTGIIIYKLISGEYFIDNFLMSCRVLSRDIELKFLNETLKQLDANIINSEYIPTKKNIIVKDLYEKMGFEKISEKQGEKKYKVKTENLKFNKLDYIKVV